MRHLDAHRRQRDIIQAKTTVIYGHPAQRLAAVRSPLDDGCRGEIGLFGRITSDH